MNALSTNMPQRLALGQGPAALQDPALLAQFRKNGAIADGGTSQQFAQRIEKELAARKDIAVRQHIVLE